MKLLSNGNRNCQNYKKSNRTAWMPYPKLSTHALYIQSTVIRTQGPEIWEVKMTIKNFTEAISLDSLDSCREDHRVQYGGALIHPPIR